MTVRDLILALKDFDADKKVRFCECSSYHDFSEVRETESSIVIIGDLDYVNNSIYEG